MDHRTNYNEKALVCIRQVRRGFLFVILLMLAAIAVMYGSTENIFSSRTMNVKTFQNVPIAGGLKTPSSNPTEHTVNKLQYRGASPLDVIKTEPPQETNATQGSDGTHTTSLEFPGMPDPCLEPRRKTVVEDLLCMVCLWYLHSYLHNTVGSYLYNSHWSRAIGKLRLNSRIKPQMYVRCSTLYDNAPFYKSELA